MIKLDVEDLLKRYGELFTYRSKSPAIRGRPPSDIAEKRTLDTEYPDTLKSIHMFFSTMRLPTIGRNIVTLVLAALAVHSQGVPFTPGDSPPNILCILVDDLGYGDLGCMGATDLRTPHIDQLAEMGMTFRNFYANCTVCSPSRASLLTGRYPDLVGVPGVIRQFEDNSWGYLDPGAILVPEVLNRVSYHTGMIGKWHLGFESPNTPNDRGFDYFKGFLADMMDDYWTHLRGGVNWMRLNREAINPEGHATELFTRWTIDYLAERKEDRRPFFLYLAYNAPHFPIQPPPEYLERVKAREPGLSEKRAKNVAFIEHLDENVGRVIEALGEMGLMEHTLIVFTSDNGGALPYAQSNGNLRGGKQDMYEGGIRVPAFVCWKNHIEPGSVTESLAMLMDLYPTFCQVAGARVTHPVNGISLVPTLSGKSQDTDGRTLFWSRREGGTTYGGQAYYAARRGRYKILQNTPYEPIQMFDMAEDELEQHPLEPVEGSAEMKAYRLLRNQLQQHIRSAGSVPWQQPGTPASED